MSSRSSLLASLATLTLLGCASSQKASVQASATVEELPPAVTSSAPPQSTLGGDGRVGAEDGFTVMMPGEPQLTRSRVAIQGGEVQVGTWKSSVEGALFSVSYADYPEPVIATKPPMALVNEGRDSVVASVKGTLLREQEVTLDGVYPGKAYVAESPSGEVRARHFLVGNRLYTLLALFNPSIGSPQADAFLSSLALRVRP